MLKGIEKGLINKKITIAIDAMGGDKAPVVVVRALGILCDKLLKSGLTSFCFRVYGDSDKILFLIRNFPKLTRYVDVVHSDDVLLPEDRPSFAIRKRKNSSMYQAVLAVQNKEADCVVSAGNTGALMAISKVILGNLPDIYRSALVATIPSVINEVVLLDLGANVESNSEVLFQFGIMGSAFCQSLFNKRLPRVGLLNIGSEEEKGTDTVKEAYHLFRANEDKINFIGYVEPDKMLKGEVGVDVVVSDGFSGNLILKMAEGTLHLVKSAINESMCDLFLTRMLRPLFFLGMRKAFIKFDPNSRNGAMLVGLNGIVIKSHGGSDEFAFVNAVEVAIYAVLNDLNQKIISHIDGIG